MIEERTCSMDECDANTMGLRDFVKYTTRRLATTYGAPAWGSPATDR